MAKGHIRRHAPSQRQLRVAEILRHELSRFFMQNNFWDNELDKMRLTVSEVRIDASLRHATIYIIPLGGDHMDEAVALCTAHMGKIRHAVVKNLNLKYAPEFIFKADRSFDEAAHIDRLLRVKK